MKAKNVCLHLVDSHTTLKNSGVVQLFTQPHPQKVCASPYWGKVPPRILSPLKGELFNLFSKAVFTQFY